jgi:5-methyltetrahydrofolate--homocysteine methyltransferase
VAVNGVTGVMEKYERFKKVLKERVIIFDGAMGTMLQKLGLSPEDFGGAEFEMLSDILSISKPEALKNVHMEYLKAGADCIETNTFGASALRLKEYDFSQIDPGILKDGSADFDIRTASFDEIAYNFNIASCKVARAAIEAFQNCTEYDGRELFVAGSVGPSNYVLSSTEADLKKGTWEQVEDNFFKQVKGLIDGGADIILFETQQDILEVKAAVAGAKRAMEVTRIKLPVMVQVTVDEFSRMQIFNTDITAALTTVKDIGIDAFGINCSLGPDLMEPSIRKLSEFSDLPISVLPNAGLPDSEDGRTVYRLTPEELARYLHSFVKNYGVNIVGGCCGTTPDHIRRIRACVKDIKPESESEKTKLFLSGPQNAVEIDGAKELIRIGERLNVRGSKKVRDAVESDTGINYNALEEVVREQIEDLGTSVIDICMDSAVVDTKNILPDVIKSVTADFKGVLCLDSFDPDALEAAIKVYPGRPLINSISMENYSPGKSKAEKILECTAFHSPVYIGLAADDKGPAQTREEKIKIAEQLVATCGRFNIPPAQLLVDINAFPIGSESSESMNFALESLECIPEIKKLGKGLKTTIGVSNLTNGLAKKPYMRMVLTSVFLDEARKRGLDAAIVNPNHYVPVSSIDKKDYKLALGIILNRDMDAFTALEETARIKQGRRVVPKKRYEDLKPADAVCEKIKDGIKNKQQGELFFNSKPYKYSDTIVIDASKALEDLDPVEFINSYLMAAMEALGDKFAAGEVSLPHLLKSADVMKQVMEFIEATMNSSSDGIKNHRATIVLGTVYQDVHSIGKDLTRTLLENYGYRVIDLGVQVPLEAFIETAKKEKADVIGMSSLLVQTANHMITVAEMMEKEELDIPILIGGAPVNLRHAAYVAYAGKKDPGEIKKDVFYCASAMGCINVLENLFSEKRAEYINNNGALLKREYAEIMKKAKNKRLKKSSYKKVDFSGYTVAECPIRVSEFTPRVADIEINRTSLQSLNWKAGSSMLRKKQGITEASSNDLIDHWIHEADRNSWVEPMGRMGVFRCNSDGNSLVIYDPSDEEKEIARVDFESPEISDNQKPASVARYFLPKESGKKDIVGLQIVTAGTSSGKAVEMFRENGDSESAHLLYGLANRVAEDFAGMLHHELKISTGSDEKAGKRYSPGYPGLKLENNAVIHDLLRADELGITMTEAHGFLPLSTTSALVCFHPEAEYF